MFCHAIIGTSTGKERIMKVDISAEFISPLLSFSQREIKFCVMKVSVVKSWKYANTGFLAKNEVSLNTDIRPDGSFYAGALRGVIFLTYRTHKRLENFTTFTLSLIANIYASLLLCCYNNSVIQRRSKYGTCYGHFTDTQIHYKLFTKVYIDKIGYTVTIKC